MSTSPAHLDPQRSAHLAWLHTLYLLLETTRREGLFGLEDIVLSPDGPGTPFSRFPLTREEPYRTLVCDFVQVVIEGAEGESLRRYGAAALWGLRHHGGDTLDESLLQTIWLTLEAGLVDRLPPRTACEFGRQALPWRQRPGYEALYDSLRATPYRASDNEEGTPLELDERIERFIASLSET